MSSAAAQVKSGRLQNFEGRVHLVLMPREASNRWLLYGAETGDPH
jgi:hypothetical protein